MLHTALVMRLPLEARPPLEPLLRQVRPGAQGSMSRTPARLRGRLPSVIGAAAVGQLTPWWICVGALLIAA